MEPVLIEIKQDDPGFNRFIGAWLWQEDISVLIDPGPANSVNRLMESLNGMGIDHLDFILLSHIHIDHAGGLAPLLNRFPMAKAICHEKAVGHVLNPSKLWEGSRKVLGEIAELYGPVEPVSSEKIIPHTEASIKGLRIFETPGHAVHHLSFSYKNYLFAGETAGVYLAVNGYEFIRPATPPVFHMDEFLESIDKLLELEDMPMCFGHFGMVEESRSYLKGSRDQLILWREIIADITHREERDSTERCVERLLAEDPRLMAFYRLAPEFQERERFFLSNSVKGFMGYLKENRRVVDKI